MFLTEPNICLLTDSYKSSHWVQYPPDVTHVYSYFESRGGPYRHATVFGLQYLLKRYLEGAVVTADQVEEAAAFWAAHFGHADLFNYEGWMHIVKDHGGKLPLSIHSVPEGTQVPARNELMTVENTCSHCHWLTNWVETLLVQAWYPSTIATTSRENKIQILDFLEQTGDPEQIDFKLHDFGFRGCSSLETSALGAAAHLLSFQGTDTVSGILLAREFYGPADGMFGFSIPASEHSTMTAWGRDGELEAFGNMLDQYPTGLVACVSDSYNIFRACEDYWGSELRDRVLGRDGTLVVRPDSGPPVETVLRVLGILGDAFGTERNIKGYKVLPPQIRVIQGDGIDYDMVYEILSAMRREGWSADNIAFGSGGGLLQRFDRDTQKFAFKCSAVKRDGRWRAVYKDPVTDPGKESKRGRLKLVTNGDTLATVPRALLDAAPESDHLVEVFRDGEVLVDWTFEDVRQRVAL